MLVLLLVDFWNPTYTEMMVRGTTPQLPISGGLTMARLGSSSSVQRASWYI